MTTYRPRLMDQRLQELLQSVPAVSVEGARAVGKTRTARTHGTTFIAVDDPDERAQLTAIRSRFTTLPSPLVIDEWQRMPELWDRVRRAVDDDPSPAVFCSPGPPRRPRRPPTQAQDGSSLCGCVPSVWPSAQSRPRRSQWGSCWTARSAHRTLPSWPDRGVYAHRDRPVRR